MDEPVITIKNLRYEYPDGTGRGIQIDDLTVDAPGLTAIRGRSGSGKSSLMRVLTGDVRDYTGAVTILGRDLRDLRFADRQKLLRELGLIPQGLGLLMDVTIAQNLEQDLADAGIPSPGRSTRIRLALETVNLDGLDERRVADLSGGQAQRVAIAKALARDARAVIADEPTSGLDDNTADQVFALLGKLAETVPVVLITHDQRLASKCPKQIVLQTPFVHTKALTREKQPAGSLGSLGARPHAAPKVRRHFGISRAGALFDLAGDVVFGILLMGAVAVFPDANLMDGQAAISYAGEVMTLLLRVAGVASLLATCILIRLRWGRKLDPYGNTILFAYSAYSLVWGLVAVRNFAEGGNGYAVILPASVSLVMTLFSAPSVPRVASTASFLGMIAVWWVTVAIFLVYGSGGITDLLMASAAAVLAAWHCIAIATGRARPTPAWRKAVFGALIADGLLLVLMSARNFLGGFGSEALFMAFLAWVVVSSALSGRYSGDYVRAIAPHERSRISGSQDAG